MRIYSTVEEMRKALDQARQEGKSIGLVPTMGALHEGHGSLIKAACAETGFVVVSIFVNPTQFAPTEDLASYPRTMESDCRMAEEIGASAIFAPPVREMYPEGDSTWVEVTGHLTSILCGRSRPTHFRGVSTVVTKLLNIVGPCKAYFGQKDGQQAQVIRRMVRDLFIPAEIRVLPIIREQDGLAMSSRNAYLNQPQRRGALALSKALAEAKNMIDEGCLDKEEVIDRVAEIIKAEPEAELDYIEVYGFPDLNEIETLSGSVFIAVAVKFGGARLIDNLVVEINGTN